MVCSSCIASSEDDLIANDKRQRMKLHPLNIKERASEQTPSGHVLLEYMMGIFEGVHIWWEWHQQCFKTKYWSELLKDMLSSQKESHRCRFFPVILILSYRLPGQGGTSCGKLGSGFRGNGESETPFSLYHFLFPFSFSSFCKLCHFLSRNLKIRHLSQRAG